MAKRKFVRDVKSGRFVKQSEDGKNLKTTVIEYIDNREPKAGVKSWQRISENNIDSPSSDSIDKLR